MSKIITITLSILLFGCSLKSQKKMPPKQKQTEFRWPEGRDTSWYEYKCDTTIREVIGGYWVKISCQAITWHKRLYNKEEQFKIDSFHASKRKEALEEGWELSFEGGYYGMGSKVDVVEYFTPSLKRKD